MAIKVFVRQPLTQSTEREARIVQAALDAIGSRTAGGRYALDLVTGTKAFDRHTFRDAFASGAAFAPRAFRDARLALLAQADVMLVLRTGLSESGAFEVAYNIFGGRCVPVFFAVWDDEQAKIETTLLRDLDDLAKVRYARFADPADAAAAFARFVDEVVVPDMLARGRTVVFADERAHAEPAAATSFRQARRTARELGFPVAVRPWSAAHAAETVVRSLAELVRYVEGEHVTISAEQPLIVERATTAMPATTARAAITVRA